MNYAPKGLVRVSRNTLRSRSAIRIGQRFFLQLNFDAIFAQFAGAHIDFMDSEADYARWLGGERTTQAGGPRTLKPAPMTLARWMRLRQSNQRPSSLAARLPPKAAQPAS